MLALIHPGAAGAVPRDELAALSITSGNAQGPTAAVVYEPLNYVLVANRLSNRVTIFDLHTRGPVEDDSGNPLVLEVADGPVAIATWDDRAMSDDVPTEAYAFVAGFSGNAISVIDLLATPPEVLEEEEIDLTESSESANPGPVALLRFGSRLYVAAGLDGVIQRFDIAALPAVPEAFPSDDPNQTTANGNLVACENKASANPATVTSQARPRVLLRYSSRFWAGCISLNTSVAAGVGQFSDAGEVGYRNDLNQPDGIGSIKGLAGDPRLSESILYVLSDSDNASEGVYALDVFQDVDDDVFIEAVDPTITPICSVSGADRSSIPINAAAVSSAMISFDDESDTNGGAFLAVFSTAATGSTMDLIALTNDVPNVDNPPGCDRMAGEGIQTISIGVPLALGVNTFADADNPTDIAQQISYYPGYVVLPNYGASGGAQSVSLVMDAPLLTPDSTAPLAMTNAGAVSPGITSVDLLFTSNETVLTDGLKFAVRERGRPLTSQDLMSVTATAGNQVDATIASAVLEATTLVDADSNKYLELILHAPDEEDDVGFAARELVFDTTIPNDPIETGLTVEEGSNQLTVTVPSASDNPVDGVESGLGGFYIDFESAINEDTGEEIPVNELNMGDGPVWSGSETFVLFPLQNRFTYTFNIYVLDRAGNMSAGFVPAMGRPVPGTSGLDLLNEDGCTFTPNQTRSPWFAFSLWAAVLALALLVRRSARR